MPDNADAVLLDKREQQKRRAAQISKTRVERLNKIRGVINEIDSDHSSLHQKNSKNSSKSNKNADEDLDQELKVLKESLEEDDRNYDDSYHELGNLLDGDNNLFKDVLDPRTNGKSDRADKTAAAQMPGQNIIYISKLISIVRFTFIVSFVLLYIHKLKDKVATEEFDGESQEHFVTPWAKAVREAFVYAYKDNLLLRMGNYSVCPWSLLLSFEIAVHTLTLRINKMIPSKPGLVSQLETMLKNYIKSNSIRMLMSVTGALYSILLGIYTDTRIFLFVCGALTIVAKYI